MVWYKPTVVSKQEMGQSVDEGMWPQNAPYVVTELTEKEEVKTERLL